VKKSPRAPYGMPKFKILRELKLAHKGERGTVQKSQFIMEIALLITTLYGWDKHKNGVFKY
jgi:hypothetical protein